MIGKTPPVGPGGSPEKPEDVQKTSPTKPFDLSGGDQQTYKTWGGMNFTKKEWDMFMQNLMKDVSQQIQRDMQRSLKALKRIRDSTEGRESDD